MRAHFDAIELLITDHRRVEELFSHAESAESAGDRKRLYKEICKELEVHTFAEEAVIYPFLSKEPQFKALIEEAYDEHQEARSLLQEISMTTSDNEIDNKLNELIESVRHHVEEEESEIFPKMRGHLSSSQLVVLADQLLIAKQNFAADKAA